MRYLIADSTNLVTLTLTVPVLDAVLVVTRGDDELQLGEVTLGADGLSAVLEVQSGAGLIVGDVLTFVWTVTTATQVRAITETYRVIVDESQAAYYDIADVKRELRITTDEFDSDIVMLVAAAKSDLKLSGVTASAVDSDSPAPLIRMAIIVYCKAMFGLDNADSEKYLSSYRSLETSLALSSEYGASA